MEEVEGFLKKEITNSQFTFDQLAKTKPEIVKAILEAAGPRYKMHVPTTWAKQATLAAAGKMDELKALQAELKAGKTAKK